MKYLWGGGGCQLILNVSKALSIDLKMYTWAEFASYIVAA